MSEPDVLFISVKPHFIEKILAGEKSVELRRVRPKIAAPGTLVVFYASSPVCEVVGSGRIKQIDAATPTAIWERHRDELGLSRSEYRSYLAGVKEAVGILLEDIRPLARRIPLATIREQLEGFEPPQSFRYLGPDQAKAFV